MRFSFVFLVLILTLGCQSIREATKLPEHKLSTESLNSYKIDCNDPTQTRFLEAQKFSKNEEIYNTVMITTPSGWLLSYWDGTLDERYRITRNERAAVISMLLHQRRSWCGQ